jgi:predicted small secreted protein
MKRMLLLISALALMATGVVGCHASGDIGPNGQSSLSVSK